MADHILLQEDGDLLTIHSAPNDISDNTSINNVGIRIENEDENLDTVGGDRNAKMIKQCEEEDLFGTYVSRSPSIQTIIPKHERPTKDNTEYKDSGEEFKPFNAHNPGKEWF